MRKPSAIRSLGERSAWPQSSWLAAARSQPGPPRRRSRRPGFPRHLPSRPVLPNLCRTAELPVTGSSTRLPPRRLPPLEGQPPLPRWSSRSTRFRQGRTRMTSPRRRTAPSGTPPRPRAHWAGSTLPPDRRTTSPWGIGPPPTASSSARIRLPGSPTAAKTRSSGWTLRQKRSRCTRSRRIAGTRT